MGADPRRSSAVFRVVVVLTVAGLVPSARADVFRTEEPRTDCPRGSRSYEDWGHGVHTYCGPALAVAEECRDGWRNEIVELLIHPRLPSSPPHGAPGVVATADNTLARVVSTCDADDAEVPIAAVREARHVLGGFAGPNLALVPAGCHRMRVWIEDPTARCPTPPAEIAPIADPAAPTEIPPIVTTPPVPAFDPSAAPTEAAAVSADPAGAPVTEPVGGCACSPSRRASASWPLVGAAVLGLLGARRRGRHRGGSARLARVGSA